MAVEHRPDPDPTRRPERHHGGRRDGQGPDDFFGLDVEKLSPRVQVVTSLAVLVPVVVVVALFPYVWWLIFVVGWTVFPAFDLLLRGIARLPEGKREFAAASTKERELLEALREHGELTPARAPMETSEAGGMLRELAEGRHLDVRARGASMPRGGMVPETRREGSKGRETKVMRGGVRGIIPLPGREAAGQRARGAVGA